MAERDQHEQAWDGVQAHWIPSSIELFNFSSFSITGRGIDLKYCDTEWFAFEMNRDHSVIFEIVSKYCILKSFVDYDVLAPQQRVAPACCN